MDALDVPHLNISQLLKYAEDLERVANFYLTTARRLRQTYKVAVAFDRRQRLSPEGRERISKAAKAKWKNHRQKKAGGQLVFP